MLLDAAQTAMFAAFVPGARFVLAASPHWAAICRRCFDSTANYASSPTSKNNDNNIRQAAFRHAL